MPNLANMSMQPQPNKVLVIAPSGTGKTGLIGSLANAGYRCFVLDFDAGAQILFDPGVVRPDARKNIYLRTLTDKLHETQQIMPAAASTALKLLDDWTEEESGKTVSYGNVSTWGPRDVLIIDTLGFFGDACLRYVLFFNNRLGKQPQIQDYGSAMDMLEKLLEKIYSDHTRCNVVVMAHGSPMTDAAQMTVKMVPIALGSKLPPKVPRFFNNMITLEKRIDPATKKISRHILTNATPLFDLKTIAPTLIPAEMPADLAKFFELLDRARATGVPQGQASA